MNATEPKKKGKFSADKARKVMESLMAELARIYKSAVEYVHTDKERSERLNTLKSGESWQRLPDRDIHALYYYERFLWHEYWNKLMWTHVLDGVRRECHDPIHEGRHHEIGQQEPSLSAHCYAVAINRNGTITLVFVPFNESDRQLELESGRLQQKDLDAIRDPYRNEAKITHLIPDGGICHHTRQQLIRIPSSVGDVQNQAGLSHYLLGQVKF